MQVFIHRANNIACGKFEVVNYIYINYTLGYAYNFVKFLNSM